MVAGVLAIETLAFALILRGCGNDVNRRDIAVLPAYRPICLLPARVSRARSRMGIIGWQ